MALHLTPDMLVAAYDFLKATPPFNSLKLPEADDVEFRIIKAPTYYGEHEVRDGQQIISISAGRVSHTSTLILTMAHEMVHLWQAIRGHRDTHGRTFQRLAMRVCDQHGFDLLAF